MRVNEDIGSILGHIYRECLENPPRLYFSSLQLLYSKGPLNILWVLTNVIDLHVAQTMYPKFKGCSLCHTHIRKMLAIARCMHTSGYYVIFLISKIIIYACPPGMIYSI